MYTHTHTHTHTYILMFIFERERDRAQVGEGQRKRETQNLKQAPGSELSAQSWMQGSNSQTARSWPEPKSDAQPTEPPRCPLFFLKKIFIYFWEKERQSVRGGGTERERERGRHRNWSRLQALSCQHRAGCRARTHEPRDHDLSRSQMLNWLSHPGAPLQL